MWEVIQVNGNFEAGKQFKGPYKKNKNINIYLYKYVKLSHIIMGGNSSTPMNSYQV